MATPLPKTNIQWSDLPTKSWLLTGYQLSKACFHTTKYLTIPIINRVQKTLILLHFAWAKTPAKTGLCIHKILADIVLPKFKNTWNNNNAHNTYIARFSWIFLQT
jgi:hypothetical protein